jgi:hypothetical protein
MTIRKGSKHKIEKLFCILILGAILLILLDRWSERIGIITLKKTGK